MKYAVGYLNFLDNELFLEVVDAESRTEAIWGHSKLCKEDWKDVPDGVPEDYEDLLDLLAQADVVAESVEVPE